MTAKDTCPGKAGVVELNEAHLDEISGGPNRQPTDPIGNFNFKVEIEGVTQQAATLKSR